MSGQAQQWNPTPVYQDGDLSEGGELTDPEPDMHVDPPPPADLDPADPRGRRPCPFDKLQCCYCWTFVRTPLHMRKHMLNKHLDVKDHACHICGKTFARPYMLRDHLARFHDMGVDKRVQKRDPIKCTMCDKVLAGQDSHKRHMFSVHNVGSSPHVCHVCGKQFYKPYEVKDHLAKDHGLGEASRRQERKRHMCNVCGKILASSVSLKRHLLEVHKIMDEEAASSSSMILLTEHRHFYKCYQCDKVLTSQINLQQHKYVIHGEDSACPKPQACHICGRAFLKVSAFKEHMESHYWGEEGEVTTAANLNANLRCHICGKYFQQLPNLKCHLLAVHNEESHNEDGEGGAGRHNVSCQFCGKVVYHDSSLRRHLMAQHDSKQNLQCDHCEFRTDYDEKLRKHVREQHTHSDLHRHPCPYEGCSYAPSKEYVLKAHIKMVHLKHRGVSCPHCDYRAMYASIVNGHIRRRHGGLGLISSGSQDQEGGSMDSLASPDSAVM